MERRTFELTEENINTVIEEIKTYLADRKIADRDVLKLGLLIEEVLLRYRDRFGKQQEVVVVTTQLARAMVLVRLKGEQYDPLHEDKDESILSSQFIQNLLEVEETSMSYRYRNGYNEIIAMARRRKKAAKIPGGTVTIAIILAILAAVLTKKVIPADVASFLVNDLAAPLLSKLMGLITMVTGPLIFISVISGICALDDIATLSSIGMKAISRFLIITLLLLTYSVFVSLLFFPGISTSADTSLNMAQIIGLLLDLIPQDLVSPFVESKTIQIIIIATAIGVSVLMLGEKIPNAKTLIHEANQLIFNIMELVSKIIPLAVFLSIYKAVVLNDISDIFGVWKVVVANYVAMVPFTIAMVLYVCLRRNINVRQFLIDISEPAMIGFSTASGTLAMAKNFEVGKKVLKKDEKFVDFWVPLSHAMFSPSVVPPLVIAAFYAGSYYGTPISLPQILVMYILVTQLSIASPKVPGGIVATFTILLGQLGMSTDIVGLLMVSNVFVVNAVTGLAMVIRSTEMEELADVLEASSNEA